jgi:hypothetical protein
MIHCNKAQEKMSKGRTANPRIQTKRRLKDGGLLAGMSNMSILRKGVLLQREEICFLILK